MSAPPAKKSKFHLKGHPLVKYQNVLRWTLTIEDMMRLREKLVSPKMKIDDRKWVLHIVKNDNDLEIYLFFKNERKNTRWLMQIDGECKVVKDSKVKSMRTMKMSPNECFTHGKRTIRVCVFRDHFCDMSRAPFHIELIFNSKFYDFSLESGKRSDVVLDVDNVIFDVNKEILMTYSGLFAKLLATCEKDVQIEVSNYNSQQFCHFLAAINPNPITADMNSYEFLMKMGDDFECPALHLNVEKFLIETNQVTLIEKLKLADAREDYERLLQSVIDSLQTARQIKNLAMEEGFPLLKKDTQYRVMMPVLKFL